MMESRTRRFLRIRACSPAAGRASCGSKNLKERSRRCRAAGRECDPLMVACTEASIAELGLRKGAEAGSRLLRSQSRYDPCSLQAKNTGGVSVGSRFFLHHST